MNASEQSVGSKPALKLLFCVALFGLCSAQAESQNYCLKVTVKPDNQSYWQTGTHTSEVTMKNNGGTTIPVSVTLHLNNRMLLTNDAAADGRTLTSLPSQTTIPGTSAATGVGCVDMSSSDTDGFTAETKCTFTLDTPLSPGASITGTYQFNFAGPPLTVARMNGYSQVFYDTGAAEIVTSGWTPTCSGTWASDRVPFGINIQKSRILSGPVTNDVPPVMVGERVKFRLKVKNVGPAVLGGVATGIPKIVDTLPSGLSNITASGTNWTCGVTGQTVTCEYSRTGPIKLAGQFLVSDVMVEATANTAGNFSNCTYTQTILYDAHGPGPGFHLVAAPDSTNNQSCASYVVAVPRIDVGINKSEAGNVKLGVSKTFTLSPRNLGPGTITTVTGVTVIETLPANFGSPITYTPVPPAPPAPWNCTVSGQTVTCTYVGSPAGLGFLPPITVSATAIAAGTYSNCATISLSPTKALDSNSANNQKCVTGQVTR
jgi:uncharacterized repeat protein (TIGR01451 family)